MNYRLNAADVAKASNGSNNGLDISTLANARAELSYYHAFVKTSYFLLLLERLIRSYVRFYSCQTIIPSYNKCYV